MRRRSILTALAGAAAFSCVAGCTNRPMGDLATGPRVEVAPHAPRAMHQQFVVHPFQLGAGDSFGNVAYALYLAHRLDSERINTGTLVEVDSAGVH